MMNLSSNSSCCSGINQEDEKEEEEDDYTSPFPNESQLKPQLPQQPLSPTLPQRLTNESQQSQQTHPTTPSQRNIYKSTSFTIQQLQLHTSQTQSQLQLQNSSMIPVTTTPKNDTPNHQTTTTTTISLLSNWFRNLYCCVCCCTNHNNNNSNTSRNRCRGNRQRQRNRRLLYQQNGNQQNPHSQRQNRPSSSSSCFYYGWYVIRTSKVRKRMFYHFVNKNFIWKCCLVYSTIILLFGGPIRDLLIPHYHDTYQIIISNIFFIVPLFIFIMDILIRMDCQPHYFTIYYKGQIIYKPYRTDSYTSYHDQSNSLSDYHMNHPDRNETNNNNNNTNNNTNNNNATNNNNNNNNNNTNRSSNPLSKYLSIGTFLFYCDVISTMTLLYEISWINSNRFQENILIVYVGEYNIPLPQSWASRNAWSHSYSTPLFVAIAKTARVVRFIRSSGAVEISSKINWYFFTNIFDITWLYHHTIHKWYQRFATKHQEYKQQIQKQRTYYPPPQEKGGLFHWFSKTERDRRMAQSAASRRVFLHQSNISFNASFTNQDHHHQHKKNVNHYDHSKYSSFLQVLLLNVFGGKRYEEYRRHQAAITIQRAWIDKLRRLNAGNHDRFSDDDDDENEYYKELGGTKRERSAYFGRGGGSGSGGGGGGMEHKLSHKNVGRSTSRHSLLKINKSVRQSMVSRDRRNAFSTHNSKLNMSNRNSSSNIGNGGRQRTKNRKSQVGGALREITAHRIAIGMIVALLLAALLTYTENNKTRQATMITLNTQTQYTNYIDIALDAARNTSIPDLLSYTLVNGTTKYFHVVEDDRDGNELRPSEKLIINVYNTVTNESTSGLFNFRRERKEEAIVSLLSTIFIILLWFYCVTAFAGPVIVLVIAPMERMVRLLAMLTDNPLGYEKTRKYKKFVNEEVELTRNTRWTKEVLKGMETSFLMSTILRIGRLMKVGFGSAGVEIIRKNFNKGKSDSMLILSSQGSTVSCIFLFCDIRNFTDATECLQEEVFVFTNQIAAVVHSYCAAYGGSANKNIGDAFLVSWMLDDDPSGHGFIARNNQADKALLAVVRICMALRYDDHYLGQMSEVARDTLVKKLQHREGPLVQMGFGLHAGKAVQGAIGSHRKIDATYVSEAVEMAEFLESSTKKYGLLMLMSNAFHDLLDHRNKRRCRKVDQISIKEETDEEQDEDEQEIIELLTFDIDVDAWWNQDEKNATVDSSAGMQPTTETTTTGTVGIMTKRKAMKHEGEKGTSTVAKAKRKMTLKLLGSRDDVPDNESSTLMGENSGTGISGNGGGGGIITNTSNNINTMGGQVIRVKQRTRPLELKLPNGPAFYTPKIWLSNDMRIIREKYAGMFYQKFHSGLRAFYMKDWIYAKECFTTILATSEDGPSRYFLLQIEEYDGKPPKNFKGYGLAD